MTMVKFGEHVRRDSTFCRFLIRCCRSNSRKESPNRLLRCFAHMSSKPAPLTMMHPSSERTPLLYRGIKRVDESGGESSHSGYQEIKQRKQPQSLCRRVSLPLNRLLHAGSLLSTPPLDDEFMYEDVTNDDPVRCSCGTREDDGIWLNHADRIGCTMSVMVWVLFLYSALTVVLLAQSGHCPKLVAAVYCTLSALALACHIKTSLTDPGSIPASAVPISTNVPYHTMCSVCQTYKPDRAHHCRICNRCISRMDHHCPWMNTCIGTYVASGCSRRRNFSNVEVSLLTWFVHYFMRTLKAPTT